MCLSIAVGKVLTADTTDVLTSRTGFSSLVCGICFAAISACNGTPSIGGRTLSALVGETSEAEREGFGTRSTGLGLLGKWGATDINSSERFETASNAAMRVPGDSMDCVCRDTGTGGTGSGFDNRAGATGGVRSKTSMLEVVTLR